MTLVILMYKSEKKVNRLKLYTVKVCIQFFDTPCFISKVVNILVLVNKFGLQGSRRVHSIIENFNLFF